MLIGKILSMVDQMKKDLDMNRWMLMPKHTYEYRFYALVCGKYEADGCHYLGKILYRTGKDDEYKKYFQKARILYNLTGLNAQSQDIDNYIALTKRERDPNQSDGINLCEFTRKNYELVKESFGLTAAAVIHNGVEYAIELKKAYRRIEASRLLTNLAADSRRVLGPEHHITKKADQQLQDCKERLVCVQGTLFQAMRYENDGAMCVVKGPIKDPRQIDGEREFHHTCDLIHPVRGCPVICHGKLGEVGEFQEHGQFEVHFEDASQKPASANSENLRIAFELPDQG
jgi:hypothetical protein